jgi:hypothetical protein
MVMGNLLVAVRAEFFLFPWGFVPITVVTATAFAFAAAATVTTADDIRYLLALFRKFGLEKREGIEGLWYGCACGSVQSVLFLSRRE